VIVSVSTYSSNCSRVNAGFLSSSP
jgi:predicted  nucleic acid-binding Zn-ribbon protein